jgi:hypothetical protein
MAQAPVVPAIAPVGGAQQYAPLVVSKWSRNNMLGDLEFVKMGEAWDRLMEKPNQSYKLYVDDVEEDERFTVRELWETMTSAGQDRSHHEAEIGIDGWLNTTWQTNIDHEAEQWAYMRDAWHGRTPQTTLRMFGANFRTPWSPNLPLLMEQTIICVKGEVSIMHVDHPNSRSYLCLCFVGPYHHLL